MLAYRHKNGSLVPNFPKAVHILFRLLRASPHVSQYSSLYATNIRQVVKHQPQERDSLRMSPMVYQPDIRISTTNVYRLLVDRRPIYPASLNCGKDLHLAYHTLTRYCAGRRLVLSEHKVHVFHPLIRHPT